MEIKMIKTGCLFTNTYIVSNGSTCLVIDPGDELSKINEYLNSKNLKVRAILLTHGHYDHFGVAKELALIEHCHIYASLYDKELFEDSSKNGSRKFSKNDLILDNITYFDEEVILELGEFVVEVVFLPGHTPGSVAYIVGEALFSGDTLFKGTYGRVDLYGGNKNDMKKSLEYLFSLDSSLKVFPGHGDVTTLEVEKMNYKV